MKVEILGPGCGRCFATEEVVRKVLKKLGIKAEIVHVNDMNKIIEYGVMMTPAVAIDGEVKIEGKVPTENDVEKIIKMR